MHIGINTLFLIPGEVGGSETYARETLGAMARAPDSTDTFTLFTNRENDALWRADLAAAPQVRFVPVPVHARSRPARILAEQFLLPRIAAREHLDVLWSPGYTAPLFYRGRQALSILDMQYKSHPGDLTFAARMATGALVPWGARRCGRLIAISEFSRDEIVRHTGVPSSKIAVTPLAADAAFAAPAPSKGWTELCSRHPSLGQPYLLCVAHSYPHKNIAALLEAYGATAGSSGPALVWVGKARLGEPDVQRAFRALPASARVVRMEGLARGELIALYQHALLFVFPSRYEGFGLPVLEAMTAGTPVLAARTASIPEIGGETIAYFDPEKPGDFERALREALGWTEAVRAQKIAAARERASRFSWERTARETRAALYSV